MPKMNNREAGFILLRRSLLPLLLILNTLTATSQTLADSNARAFKSVIAAIKNTDKLSYKFQVQATFPDNTSQQFSGQSYVDRSNKIVLNDSKAATILLNGNWYYNADHINKTLLVINIDRHYTAEQKKELEHNIFGNGHLNDWVDSIVLKFGKVNTISVKENQLTAKIGFPSGLAMRQLEFTYDRKNSQLVKLQMDLYEPWQKDKRKGTSQVVSCSGYSQSIDKKKIDPSSYFTVVNGKVILKKYTNYTLNQKI